MSKIITLHSTESTNRDAISLAEQGAEHGTAIIAITQTMGRGRLGKAWVSPSGKGLYCSVIIRPKIVAEDYPKLTFVAGIAVADAIQRTCFLTPGLKWPNDIYFQMRKCGGILTESSSLNGPAANRFAVVGIGLNVNTQSSDFPVELRSTATSLGIECSKAVDIQGLFQCIRNDLLEQVALFERDGFNDVIRRWRKRDFLLGKRLTWVSINRKKVDGVSLGPDDEGRLHVRDDEGNVHEVLSGDIQLAVE